MRIFLGAILALILSPSHALDCENARTTQDMNRCAKQDQEIVEAKLNKVYQRVLGGLNKPGTEPEQYLRMKEKLILAQRAWIKFRDADCDAVHERYKFGTIVTVYYLSCMRSHAERRIADLENYEKD